MSLSTIEGVAVFLILIIPYLGTSFEIVHRLELLPKGDDMVLNRGILEEDYDAILLSAY